ncbi:uncharacterized protein THITE_2120621 [Thermothielavioides terrestris NRRL 8126]|uniref:Cytochrome P450-like protein n=1 Tax=Thermothielavioides terrestris (strain ATCC 38088 / NRRL 8126) TaxID=578455 RepID=G2RCX9_THETT|nr:uncharacterized protein THITE_2120621 [Thermothielavioides terrestris NRRL 8126]AEO69867.1 hypothetical protein THITE_2120621 [Thermothielavioides terrestris NRRL 8126]
MQSLSLSRIEWLASQWSMTPLALSLSLLLVILTSYVAYQRLLSPFAGIPGPFWASLSRLWLTWHARKGDLHTVMMRLHEKHGKLVRIAPSEVSISDLNAIKTIYGAGSKFRKSSWYSVWQGRRDYDLFGEQDERVHAAQRRLVSRPYAMSSLKQLEPYVDNAVLVFLNKLGDMAGQVIDLGNWFQLFAFDVIGEITFSKPFGFMDAGTDDGSFKPIQDALFSGAWVGQVPWLFWLSDFLSPVIGQRLAIAGRNTNWVAKVVREVTARLQSGSDCPDILGQLLKVHHEKPQQFSVSNLMSVAGSNVFAGSDTTAISTRAIVYNVLKNPECKQRLLDEIDDFRRRGELSDPVTIAEAEKMPYLQAVMYEALRCHPAVGMTLPRVVPPEGLEVDGHYLPAGSIVGVNPWVVHRNKDVYGHDADTFRPERWLKADTADMHRFFFAFGSGARTCIGKSESLPVV